MPEEAPAARPGPVAPGDVDLTAVDLAAVDLAAVDLAAVDLAAVEAAVGRALAARTDTPDAGRLRVLGFGEMSLVIGWPTDAPEVACKRLPLFADREAAETYRGQFEAYLRILRERGVQPLPSAFGAVPSTGGAGAGASGGPAIAGYVVQPVVDAATLGPEVMRREQPAADHPLLLGVTRAVVAVPDERTGLDAQISNWAWSEDRGLRYLDVTTPLRFDHHGNLQMDTGLFLATYPWVVRSGIGRLVAPGVAAAYRDPRRVLVDLAANLIKERLETWIPVALEVANEYVSPAITPREVHRYYRSDAQMWELMLRLRRADRWWQHNVRRRDYQNLLPGRIER